MLSGNRLHLNHGPIDLVIGARGADVAAAFAAACARFPDILPTLVAELSVLRAPMGAKPPPLTGPVARRMAAAVWPHRGVFVTPMAAVAGAVADEMLAAMVAATDLAMAYVNDGGDIALHLAPGERFDAGVVADATAPAIDAVARIDAASPVRGLATSGRGGRSFSLGIANAVTVLARTAAEADAAATLIANAVDLPGHPAITRRPARDLDPDSDLGDLPVTVDLGPLTDAELDQALAHGVMAARAMHGKGLIVAAFLTLRGRSRMAGQGVSGMLHSAHPSGGRRR
ncbi:MAG: UPF0280 family protein [Alphaproteobacteria bacterium]|nr:UPF0280 family protein [Alphaproteobacteria bacterium]